MTPCGHPLCSLIGEPCSLASGVSRGCQTGPRHATPVPAALVDEVSGLLEQLAAALPDDDATQRQRAAATRLAFLFRREARNARSLLSLAADGDLEPALGDRLSRLCRKPG